MIVVLSSLSTIILTRHHVKKTLFEMSGEEARSTVRLARSNIENEYRSIIYQREYALNRYKKEMKDISDTAISFIDRSYGLWKRGILTEEEAKRHAVGIVRDLRYGYKNPLFIYDLSNLIYIYRAGHAVAGRRATDFKDKNGMPVISMIKKRIPKGGSVFYNFKDSGSGEKTPVEMLNYLIYYKKWNWAVGASISMDDIHRDENKRIESVLKELKGVFSGIHIGRTGFLFLFDRNKRMLIHPSKEGQDFAGFRHPVTGNNHADKLIEASKNPDVPYVYTMDKPDDPGNYRYKKICYVTYFEPLGWYLGATVFQEELNYPASLINAKQTVLAIIISIISVFCSMVLVRKVTDPLVKLAGYTDNISKTGFDAFDDIEIKLKPFAGRFKDEVGRLADSFSYMITSLKRHAEQLRETIASREKIRSELRIAHDIQMAMLPDPPSLVRDDVELYALLAPARDVGGDLYDFFMLNDHQVCILIGDVSDKGVPAALFMSMSKTAIRLISADAAEQTGNVSPSRVLMKVNRELCRNNPLSMFVTLFYGVLDLEKGTLKYANAGHNPPLIMTERGNRKAEFLEKGKGGMLAVYQGVEFEEKTITLHPDDVLFLYTDGITEAMDIEGNFFSADRLKDVISQSVGKSTQELAEKIFAEVKEYSKGIDQSDDIAIMAVKYRGKSVRGLHS